MTLNDSQQRIVDQREEFVVADAGPGTGKTHTVTHRCLEILRDGLRETDRRTAMLTFTRNAAAEMRNRIINTAAKEYLEDIDSKPEAERNRLLEEYGRINKAVREMFVGTFDSFCLNIVKKAPGAVSSFFRFDAELTSSAATTENETLNRVFFLRFINEWLEANGTRPEYGDYPAIITDQPLSLYRIIERLMCMGIMPLRSGGWFGCNLRKEKDDIGPAGEPLELRGNPAEIERLLRGYKISGTSDFSKCFNSMYIDGFVLPTLSEENIMDAAYENRDVMLRTIHDVYYAFIEKCVSCDHLTFGLTACFAFVILYTNTEVREGPASYDYLIVDEFQDTNTLQMMISMMVLRKPNLCVVGDWRQGIYGFRYVSPENITDFENRLKSLAAFLNDDGIERVRYPICVSDIHRLSLDTSYRSSQRIIHAAYQALVIPGSDKDKLDPEECRRITDTEIRSGVDDVLKDDTWIVRICTGSADSEPEEVVRRISSFVNDRTRVYDMDAKEWRDARLGDVAVLCRTTKGCRKVYSACIDHGIPVFLQGDIEIMNTPEGKLLLSWLRFTENSSDARGYVPILAFLGYSPDEISAMEKLPEGLEFQRQLLLRKTRRIADFIAAVYKFHGICNDISQAISDVISTAHKGSLMTISEVISMMEDDIAARTTYPVDGQPSSNAVVIQTAHKSKGLEYPLVIIPFMDTGTFPINGNDYDLFRFSKTLGVRCSKTMVRMANGDLVMDGSWKTKVAAAAEPRDYDEERRLLFVALSRAKQYIYLISGKQPSKFYNGIAGAVDSDPGEDEIPPVESEDAKKIDAPDVSFEHISRPITLAVHDIMGGGGAEDMEADRSKGKGMNYGTRVHRAAEMMANGTVIDDDAMEAMPELHYVRKTLRSLPDGAINTETPCALHLEVDGRNVVLNGNIDLMVVDADTVRIFDWKTDATTKYRDDYCVQLSVYAQCARRYYPDKKVEASIVWLSDEVRSTEKVEILSEDAIRAMVSKALKDR